jgi:hypothetical protein
VWASLFVFGSIWIAFTSVDAMYRGLWRKYFVFEGGNADGRKQEERCVKNLVLDAELWRRPVRRGLFGIDSAYGGMSGELAVIVCHEHAKLARAERA